MYKKISLLIAALVHMLAANLSHGQSHELGQVTVAELQERYCPIDSSAPAAYLFHMGEFIFGDSNLSSSGSLKTTYWVKLKIYKPEGYKFASEQLYQYVYGDRITTYIDEAYTYNLVDGKIEKTKLKSENIFVEKKDSNHEVKKFTMPNVHEGSIVEFKITTFALFSTWDFQKRIPSIYSSFEIIYPDLLELSIGIKGVLSPFIIEDVAAETGNINYRWKQKKYILEKIPALRSEPYCHHIENYRSALFFSFNSINHSIDWGQNYAANSWEGIGNKIQKNSEFKQLYDWPKSIKEIAQNLCLGAENDADKINRIYQYVASQYTWNQEYSFMCSDRLRKILETKTGNSADINAVLFALLKESGYYTTAVLISTRDNGIPLYPNINAFNHLIVDVQKGGQHWLLDATSRFAKPNLLPLNDLNWTGLALYDDAPAAQISLQSNNTSNALTTGILDLDANGQIHGKFKCFRDQYLAYTLKTWLKEKSKDEYVSLMEKHWHQASISSYTVTGEEAESEAIVENFEVTHVAAVEKIDSKMVFTPLLFLPYFENVFTSKQREYPIDFDFPYLDKTNMSINIPEGYAIEQLPQSLSMMTSDNEMSFSLKMAKTEKTLQILYKFQISSSIIAPQKYEEIRYFVSELHKKLNEKIVLIKL